MDLLFAICAVIFFLSLVLLPICILFLVISLVAVFIKDRNSGSKQ